LWPLLIHCFLTFTLSQSGEPTRKAPEVSIEKLKDRTQNDTLLATTGPPAVTDAVTNPVTSVTVVTTTLLSPSDDNVRSVKKDMAVPIPGIAADGTHRNSGKKDLDMTTEEMTGGVKPRKGVEESRISGRKGVEADVAMTTTMAPEPTTTITSTTSRTTTAQKTTTKTTTEHPVLTHAPSNLHGKNVNNVTPTGSGAGSGPRLLVHHGSSDGDHANDLKTLQNKPANDSKASEGGSTSVASMVFGVILAMILVSVVLFVGFKRLDAIRRRREYRRMNDFLIDGMYNDP